MDEFCMDCHAEPRKAKRNGGYFPRCEECQRLEWAAKRRKTRSTGRVCKTCGEQKPLEEFPTTGKTRKKICNACASSSKVKPIPAKKLVLIDTTRQRVYLCDVTGCEPLSKEVRPAKLARQFLAAGYHVMTAGQLEPVEAGD